MSRFFIGCFNKSVILTYLSIISTLIGTFGLFNDNVRLSVVCLVVSGICDMYDGTIARMCKRTEKEKEFGVQLDSIADIVNFGFYPVLIFIKYYELSWLTFFISMIYLLSGINRLCWFNISKNKGEFKGVPITSGVLGVSIVYILGRYIDMFLAQNLMALTIIIMSIMFSSNITISKPGKRAFIVFTILAIIEIGMILI